MIAKPLAATLRLNKFIDTCREINDDYEAFGSVDEMKFLKLSRQLPTVAAILHAIEMELPSADGHRMVEDLGWRRSAAAVVSAAVGAIEDEQEVIRIIGPSGPRLAAGELHPTVWTAAARLWDGGNRSTAVQRGATAVVELVRDMTGVLDLHDSDLFNQSFSDNDPTPDRPRLRWPGDERDQTVKSMRSGLRSLAVGLLQTVRNPATHSTNEIPQDEALEKLAAFSLLTRMIEHCVVVRADD